jgi:phage baseplate assembly protein W
MDERTGKVISGADWTKQAVWRAVKTLKGSRRMLRWYGTNHLKYLAREITSASVLDLTLDLAESIEGSIPGANLTTVSEQKDGEQLLVALNIETQDITIGVTN